MNPEVEIETSSENLNDHSLSSVLEQELYQLLLDDSYSIHIDRKNINGLATTPETQTNSEKQSSPQENLSAEACKEIIYRKLSVFKNKIIIPSILKSRKGSKFLQNLLSQNLPMGCFKTLYEEVSSHLNYY